MVRREKIKQLEAEREKELNVVYEKYDPKFKELEYKFSIEEIEADGWVRGWYYPIRGNKNEWVYQKRVTDHDFFTKDVNIIFDEDGTISQVIANNSPNRDICDMEDLEFYFNN